MDKQGRRARRKTEKNDRLTGRRAGLWRGKVGRQEEGQKTYRQTDRQAGGRQTVRQMESLGGDRHGRQAGKKR